MVRSKVFFSPQPSTLISNDYISLFNNSLLEKYNVINYNDKFRPGAFKQLFSSVKTDILILNWPEDLICRRGGLFQFVASILSVVLLKMSQGKLVWVCHNRTPHGRQNARIRKWASNWYIKYSNIIIAHSQDAVKYLTTDIKFKGKIFFYPHPAYLDNKKELINSVSAIKETEVLIWGLVAEYKGILNFIEEYKRSKQTFRITICGLCKDVSYAKKIESAIKNENIVFKNTFIQEEELDLYFSKCKIILFPYLSSDVFSSGSLIHALHTNKLIIGPCFGNFKDLSEIGCCLTYTSYDQLFELLSLTLDNTELYDKKLAIAEIASKEYIAKYTWKAMIEKLALLTE